MQDNQSVLNYLLAFRVFGREDGKTVSCEKNSSISKAFPLKILIITYR